MRTNPTRKKEPKNPALCKCEHSHWVLTGSDIHDNEREAYERLNECCYCDCENFDVKE